MGRPHAPRARRVSADGAVAASVDYADAYAVPATTGRSPEQWARSVFEGPPAPVRWLLVLGWRVVLGLRLGPRRSPDHVLGWRIAARTPTRVELGLSSTATTARLVLVTSETEVVLSTLVRHERRRGQVLWTALAPIHRQLVPRLMTRAARDR